jgi:hypothetical protein
MPIQDCPVCGKKYTTKEADPYECEAVKFWCQRACGTFAMVNWFLKDGWPTVSHEDKEAIAAYLKKTKGTRNLRPLISEENYTAYVRKGSIFLRRAASSGTCAA